MSPRYPIYIPSKGRADRMRTARMFDRDGVPYHVVVEPSQAEAYAKAGYQKRLLLLPEDGKGLTYARNWITDHSRAAGDERHWQIDDDCGPVYRVVRGFRVTCVSSVALAASEDFADRYENVALLSPNYVQFVPITRGGSIGAKSSIPPFYLNHRCYTWILFLNALPYRWRLRYNEDADMTLQVLAGGWCTVLLNAFLMKTQKTMEIRGGQSEDYLSGGRLKMAHALERAWPGVVKIGRRFGHPQHVVRNSWGRFDNALRPKPGVKVPRGPNEYGMRVEVLRTPRHRALARAVGRA